MVGRADSPVEQYYSEAAMAARAPLFMLPLPLVLIAIDQTWAVALSAWAIGSCSAYVYGRWVRDDED